jgi:hypothetical protein
MNGLLSGAFITLAVLAAMGLGMGIASRAGAAVIP